MDGNAYRFCPTPFELECGSACLGAVEYYMRSAQQYDEGDEAGLDSLYFAFWFNPHVPYLLLQRSHSLMCIRDVQNSCRKVGTFFEACQAVASLKAAWQRPFMLSRLIAILDAPCIDRKSTFRLVAVALADKAKNDGNVQFRLGAYSLALEYYARAVALAFWNYENKATYLANAAQCLLKLQQPDLACAVCTAALSLQPSHIKALHRRSLAHEELGNLYAAFVDEQAASFLQRQSVGAVDKPIADRLARLEARTTSTPASVTVLQSLGNTADALQICANHIRARVQSAELLVQLEMPLRECAAKSLAIQLLTYVNVVVAASFPKDCTGRLLAFDSGMPTSRQLEAFRTVVTNLETVLLLDPCNSTASALRAQLAAAFKSYDRAKSDLLALQQVDAALWAQFKHLDGELEARMAPIRAHLDSTYGWHDFTIPTETKLQKGGRGKRMVASRFCGNLPGQLADGGDCWRDLDHMRKEMLEPIMLTTFQDCHWSSRTEITKMQRRWSALTCAQKRAVVSFDRTEEVVDRLPGFGLSEHDRRGPFAASQTWVDSNSFALQHFVAEAWDRALGGADESYIMRLAGSGRSAAAQRFASSRLVVKLPEDEVFGATLSCGLESSTVNQSNTAWWKLERMRSSVVSWQAPLRMELVESSTGGLMSLRVLLQCSGCKAYLPAFCFILSDRQKTSGSCCALRCRDCRSGVAALRGMGHLRRKDVTDKALLEAIKTIKPLGSVEDHVDVLGVYGDRLGAIVRFDYLCAVLDRFEDRLMKMGNMQYNLESSDHVWPPFLSANPVVPQVGADVNEDDRSFDSDEDQCEKQTLGSTADTEVLSLFGSFVRKVAFDGMTSYAKQFSKNTLNCCAQCGASAVDLVEPSKLKTCAGCHGVKYCSNECQVKDWSSHLEGCLTFSALSGVFAQLCELCASLQGSLQREVPFFEQDPHDITTTGQASVLAGTVAKVLQKSEKHRRRMLILHGDLLCVVCACVELLDHIAHSTGMGHCRSSSSECIDALDRSNLQSLYDLAFHLSSVLAVSCCHRVGRRALGSDASLLLKVISRGKNYALVKDAQMLHFPLVLDVLSHFK
eukprot:TRINITY_DN13797_c0_g2_i1.p1 TRINITY_DN13797_c0_g2~~TRINITY_DN13797_c0_g2_i1.p1  ORF type:complete len:1210 (+),score=104.83 TRINITY_DN13797_c0_g2_i1:401-3631(+)